MVKYIYEFKKCIVQEYLNGKGGYGSLAKAMICRDLVLLSVEKRNLAC